MPKLLYTIEEYIAVHRKKETLWIVFNTRYNEIHALKQLPDDDFSWNDEKCTDNNARQSFIAYMEENFPQVELVEVFDMVSLSYLQWPYLGSIAINADIGTEVYKALCEKYDNPDGNPKNINAVLWTMTYEVAKKHHEGRKEVLDAEFGED